MVFGLSDLDLVGEPFTVSALDQVLYIGMLINILLIKFLSIKVDLYNSEGLPTKSRALSSKITKRTTKNRPCSQYHNTN